MCPYLAQLGSVFPNLHFLLFGGMAFLAGVVNLQLPETMGRPLPEDMGDLLKMLSGSSEDSKKKQASPSTKYSVLTMEPESDLGSTSEEEIMMIPKP